MKILITAGPTREYLDDVRYISNASSGRMGYALAEVAIHQGHHVILVSGPVNLVPPDGCDFHAVETTSDMMDICRKLFPDCDGVIAAAAVCDYKPVHRVPGKMSKTGGSIHLDMIETDDVLATLGAEKGTRWVMGFALEAQNERENALQKLRRKHCDCIVLNRPTAIGSLDNAVELIGENGESLGEWQGTKQYVALKLISYLQQHF